MIDELRTKDSTTNLSYSASSYQEALAEKIRAAEKNISYVRAAVISFNTLIYFFLDKHEHISWLAITTIILAVLYSIFIIYFKPYTKYPVLISSYVTTFVDVVLISSWIFATGGLESPFHLLWYVSIIAVAFRFSARTTV